MLRGVIRVSDAPARAARGRRAFGLNPDRLAAERAGFLGENRILVIDVKSVRLVELARKRQ